MFVLWRDWYYRFGETYEFEDGKDLEDRSLHCNQVAEFCFPTEAKIKGTANGLIFPVAYNGRSENLYVCNPVTRDYAEVCVPHEISCPFPRIARDPDTGEEKEYYIHRPSISYGFGASKITGQHKVVRIFHDPMKAYLDPSATEFGCHVKTLETGSWRPVECGGACRFNYGDAGYRTFGVLINGNLHWIVFDSYSSMQISCFDLETEKFSSFSLPPGPVQEISNKYRLGLSALGGCLCLCDSSGGSIDIWLMKEYGVEESWSKEYVINKNEDIDIGNCRIIYPLKCFEDGDILMLLGDHKILCYSRETGSSLAVGNDEGFHVNAILFTPGFLSLKTLGMENVLKFR